MKKSHKAFIILVAVAIIVFVIISVSKNNSKAYITGSLGYPSSISPFQMVCAENISSGQKTCTSEADLTYKVSPSGDKSYDSYKLMVDPGQYRVYAFIPGKSGSAPTAYYSEFVTCGLSANCPSHKPIPVTALAGQTVTGINPTDWYAKN